MRTSKTINSTSTSRVEVERLLWIRGHVLDRIDRLTQELGVCKHALERVKNIQAFEEAMRKEQ